MNRILVINPGSTSTKIAVYRDHVQELVTTIEHPTELIGQFPDIISQYPMREETILNYLREKGYSKEDFTAITGRGGMVPKCQSGAYIVNETMVRRLKTCLLYTSGTPSTEILENISLYKEIRAEWASNEKVALESAIGASIAGGRALASMKHVGVNVASDALMLSLIHI